MTDMPEKIWANYDKKGSYWLDYDPTVVGLSRSDAEYTRSDTIQALRESHDRLLGACRLADQALREVSHAQDVGASWYTKGAVGLFCHVRMWLDRSQKPVAEAIKEAEALNAV